MTCFFFFLVKRYYSLLTILTTCSSSRQLPMPWGGQRKVKSAGLISLPARFVRLPVSSYIPDVFGNKNKPHIANAAAYLRENHYYLQHTPKLYVCIYTWAMLKIENMLGGRYLDICRNFAFSLNLLILSVNTLQTFFSVFKDSIQN